MDIILIICSVIFGLIAIIEFVVIISNRSNKIKKTEDISQEQSEKLQLEETEKEYYNLIENSLQGIAIMQGDPPQYVFVNSAMSNIFGYSREELLKLSYDEIQRIVLPNSKDIAKRWRRNRKSGLSSRVPRYEYRIRRKDGQERWVEIFVSTLSYKGAPATQAIYVDITERVLAVAARESLINDLEDKNAELERFTYTVSHDLKSPLVTIKGFVGMIKKDIEANNLDRVNSDIKRIESAANRMQELLEDLLELSRIGRIVNESENFGMTELSNEIVELLHGPISKANIKVVVQENMPTCYNDKRRIGEVIQNLIENAIKFRREDVESFIEVGFTEHNRLDVFFIKDNGIGVQEEYQERIFGLFNKLDNKGPGSGVGLTIVKRIIEVNHGKIWVESDGLNTGTCFYFFLPKTKEELENLKKKAFSLNEV